MLPAANDAVAKINANSPHVDILNPTIKNSLLFNDRAKIPVTILPIPHIQHTKPRIITLTDVNCFVGIANPIVAAKNIRTIHRKIKCSGNGDANELVVAVVVFVS